MASQNDYRKPKNKELRDLTWNLPHPLRVSTDDGKVLWENRAAAQLDQELDWTTSPTTWQNKKAVLQTAPPGSGAGAEDELKQLRDEVAHLRKQQRQTARKKRQSETALEKARKKQEAELKKLRQKLEKAEKAAAEKDSKKADEKLAKELTKLEKTNSKLESEVDSLKKELKRAQEESGRRLDDVDRCREEIATQANSLFKLREELSAAQEALANQPEVSAPEVDESRLEELQNEVSKLAQDKLDLEGWVQELETQKDAAEQAAATHEAALAESLSAFEEEKKELHEKLKAAEVEFEKQKAAPQIEAPTADVNEELEEELAELKADLELAQRKEKRLADKLETLEELRGEHSKVLEMLKDDLEESRERERELKSTVKLYAESHKEMDAIRDESKALKAEIKSLKDTEAELRDQLKREQIIKSTATEQNSEDTLSLSVKNQIDFLKKRLASTEKELDSSREALNREKAQNQSSKEAEKLAFQDSLTNLPNLNMVNRYLDYAHKNAIENGRAVALFVIDINGFRLLNKTYGRELGDKLLKAVGERLNGMRGGSHLMARRSQDQFLLLAADIEKVAARKFLQDASQSLLDALAYPFEVDGEEIKLTGCIGASLGPLSAENSLQLHEQADKALGLAKRQGVSKFVVFDDKLKVNEQREATYSKQMAHAIEKNEFQAVFQPVFHLAKGIVLGLELLLRWEHRDQRTLLPAEFLEPAISSGLIFKITEHVWPKAFREFSKWRKMRPGLTLSINLSDRELINPSVLKRALTLCKEHSIDPKSIIFEVRDQSRLRMSPVWWKLLQEYSGAGFGLCLDDFASDSSIFGTLAYSGFIQAKMSVEDNKGLKFVAAPQAAKGVEYGLKHIQGKFDKKALAKAGFHLAQGFAVSQPLDYADVDMVLS